MFGPECLNSVRVFVAVSNSRRYKYDTTALRARIRSYTFVS